MKLPFFDFQFFWNSKFLKFQFFWNSKYWIIIFCLKHESLKFWVLPVWNQTMALQKNPEIWQKRPDIWQNNPEIWQKNPEIWQKRPEIWQKRPEIWQKNPEWETFSAQGNSRFPLCKIHQSRFRKNQSLRADFFIWCIYFSNMSTLTHKSDCSK